MPYENIAYPPVLGEVAANPALHASVGFRPTTRATRGELVYWGKPLAIVRKNPSQNPWDEAERAPADVLVGSFMIGLNAGLPPAEKFSPDVVRDAMMEHFPGGGSAVLQLGWYKSEPENSLLVSIENWDLDVEEFRRKFSDMVRALAVRFRQYDVPYEFRRKGGALAGKLMSIRYSE